VLNSLDRARVAGARPVSGASVAFFRIAFGLALVTNNLWYLRHGRVHEYYVAPDLHFPYGPLTFIQPLPGVGMYLVFWAMAAAAALIALGLWFRWAAAAYFVLTTYKFLIDTSYFQNHDYLISLLAFLFILIPAHRMWSVDALRRPGTASWAVPAWSLFLLRFQMGVVYFFGGVAKLNHDWLRGEPLRDWLAARQDFPLLGAHFTNESVVWGMTYGALLLDLCVVPFLLWRRTRLPAFLVASLFHVMNARLFGLVIFPWLMVAATPIFFAPDWPHRVGDRLRARSRWVRTNLPPPAHRVPAPAPVGAAVAPEVATGAEVEPGEATAGDRSSRPRVRPLLAAFLVLWVGTQTLLPLRHYVIPGDPNWTEEGHRFAWHMKLRGKSGDVYFLVTQGGRTWVVYPDEYLDGKQLLRLAGHPERLVHFARFLSDEYGGAEVRAVTNVSMNGRARTPLVDPEVDLSEQSPLWWHVDWILPNDEPLPDRDRFQ
jgi:vitamin K-dependent gamma-carboxylase